MSGKVQDLKDRLTQIIKYLPQDIPVDSDESSSDVDNESSSDVDNESCDDADMDMDLELELEAVEQAVSAGSSAASNFNLKFVRQGDWVCVYYDEDYYVGQVIDFKSSEVSTVQFLKTVSDNIYRWPRTDDVADIQSSFLLCSDLDVNLSANGRTFNIRDPPDFQHLWTEYKELYAS